MTPVSSRAVANKRPLSPQLERRRELRRLRRHQLRLQSWRLLVFVMLSSGLGWILLRHGWTLEGINQVVVRGEAGLSAEEVVKAGELSFPKPLLKISPLQLEQTLLKNLPVLGVQVGRRILPPRLEVTLIPLVPVAKAVRQRGSRTEQGLVDASGQWIPLNPGSPSPKPSTTITVRGWSSQQQPQLAELLRQQTRLEGTLQAIVLRPDGSISLKSSRLGQIDLGRDAERLDEQIAAIVQLNTTLPSHLTRPNKGSLDLSNPERPELLLPVKTVPTPRAGEQ